MYGTFLGNHIPYYTKNINTKHEDECEILPPVVPASLLTRHMLVLEPFPFPFPVSAGLTDVLVSPAPETLTIISFLGAAPPSPSPGPPWNRVSWTSLTGLLGDILVFTKCHKSCVKAGWRITYWLSRWRIFYCITFWINQSWTITYWKFILSNPTNILWQLKNNFSLSGKSK